MAQYAWTTEFTIPCLEAEGFTIFNVPSESTFVDTWETAGFWPFAQVVAMRPSPEEFNRLEKICPQIAPSPVLWDGVPVSDYDYPYTGQRTSD